MIATLAACGFAATTTIATLGWWNATRVLGETKAKYETLLLEGWLFEDVIRYAGRCAWHASNESVIRPPQHLVAPHMVEHYAAGFEAEQIAEDVAAAGQNGAMGASSHHSHLFGEQHV